MASPSDFAILQKKCNKYENKLKAPIPAFPYTPQIRYKYDDLATACGGLPALAPPTVGLRSELVAFEKGEGDMKRWKAIILMTSLLAGIASMAAAQDATHVISSISFNIKGRTTERALRTYLSMRPALREGLEFPSAEALESFLELKRHDLVNERVFKSVEVADVAGEAHGGKVPHAVTIDVVDSITFFPLPSVAYNSNYGWEPDVETHYDNAFGTMTNWYLDAYFAYLSGAVRPIDKWRVHPRIKNLVMAGLPFTLDMLVDYDESKTVVGDVAIADYSSCEINADLSTKIKYNGKYYYQPELVAFTNIGYADYLGNNNFNRDYLGLTLTNTLGVGRVDWVGNFRKGYDASVYVTAKALDRNSRFGVTGEIGTTTKWYMPWRFLNYYGRFNAQLDINDEPTGLGSWLRGVADNSMSGAAGAFLNNTLAVDLVPWKGVLDLQLHPFLDAGIVYPTSRAFSLSSDFRCGAGADVVLFVDAISNFLLRCTIGLDLDYAEPWDHMEIIFNTGFSY